VISDEIGAGKARFDTVVTTKTTTATLTIAEAGTILVSAASAYTITLPTAVGNTGLTYHFIKTDANYNLITLDGNETETLNYENSTGAPTLTYARLNTYCAEVTIISDGANWQVINEKLGQVPEVFTYLSTMQLNLVSGTWTQVLLDTELYDIGNNFNTANHQFTVPITGKYVITTFTNYYNVDLVADKRYCSAVYKNGANFVLSFSQHASLVSYLSYSGTTIISLSKNDLIDFYAKSESGNNLVDLVSDIIGCSLSIRLMSKD